MIKIATVCSGIGSPEVAMKNLGIPHEIPFACEIDGYARRTYLANHKPKVMYHDMTQEAWDKPEQYADILVGGIPCQAFSLAGKRMGELDPRGLLFFDFYRYVKNQQPKVFIIENVKGLLSDAGGATFNNWVALLGQSMNTHLNMFNHPDSLMYNLHFKVLNLKDYNLPQNRERVFLVGIRNDLPNTFHFPKTQRLKLTVQDMLQHESEIDKKYYLSEAAINSIIRNPDNLQKSSINPTIASTIQCPGHSCGTYKGANYIMAGREDSLIKVGQVSLPGMFESAGRIYSEQGIAPTLTTKTGGGHEPYFQISEGIRRLTPTECLRLMGFPASFINTINNVNIINGQGINLIFKEKELWENVLQMGAKGLLKQRGSALCTIKESETGAMKTTFSSIPTREVTNVKYRAVIHSFFAEDIAQAIITLTENTEIHFIGRRSAKKSEIEKQKQVEGGELVQSPIIELLLKITLAEDLKKENAFIISTVIPTIMKLITCMYSNLNANTIGVILNYSDLPENYSNEGSLLLKEANTLSLSDTQVYRQAGNSIGVTLMQAIIQNLLPVLKSVQ